jgi:hypothetical protein
MDEPAEKLGVRGGDPCLGSDGAGRAALGVRRIANSRKLAKASRGVGAVRATPLPLAMHFRGLSSPSPAPNAELEYPIIRKSALAAWSDHALRPGSVGKAEMRKCDNAVIRLSRPEARAVSRILGAAPPGRTSVGNAIMRKFDPPPPGTPSAQRTGRHGPLRKSDNPKIDSPPYGPSGWAPVGISEMRKLHSPLPAPNGRGI